MRNHVCRIALQSTGDRATPQLQLIEIVKIGRVCQAYEHSTREVGFCVRRW